MTLADLVQLGNEDGGWTGYVHLDSAHVLRIKRRDNHRCVVNYGCLKPGSAARRPITVRRNAAAATAACSSELLGNHQVHWNATRRYPAPRLRS